MMESQASTVGHRLDAHHLPETNGRMAVCRRCGAQTNGPDGHHHVPDGKRVARSNDWLDAQTRLRSIDQARGSFTR
jgi:hypothetical protein